MHHSDIVAVKKYFLTFPIKKKSNVCDQKIVKITLLGHMSPKKFWFISIGYPIV